jgi:hypothetical protein
MKNKRPLALGMALGVAAGSVIGIITDNGGLWIPIGLAIGAGIGAAIRKKQQP